jgi:phospholipid transport system substrate-binding protein
MITRRHLLAACGALATLALAPHAWAQVQGNKPVPEAATFIADLTDKAIAGLTKQNLPMEQRAQEFRAIFTQNFDVPAIGRFALGRYWRTASEEEKAEYLKLFEDFIVGTYSARFGDYSGEKIKINGTRLGDEGEVTVFTELQRSNNSGPPYKVDWRLRRDGSTFKIFDIIAEGISMSVTQRDDFSAAIQRSGGKVSGLIASLKEKTAAVAK